MRAVGFFSGPVGFGIKIVLLALLNALVLWAAGVLVADDKWIAALIALAATALIDFVYLYPSRRLVPLKYLVPGVVFLVAFVVIPIVSNANIAFTNWSTGHNLTKDEAIVAIQEVSLVAPADGKTYTATPATQDGELVLLLVDEATGDLYVGSEDGLEPLPADSATVEIGTITAAEGYEVLQGNQLAGIDTELAALVIPAADDRFIRAEGLSLAVELQPTLEYDSAERHVHEHRDGHGLHRTTARARTSPPPGEVHRARLADARRLPELLDRPHEPALPRPVRARVRLDVRLRRALRLPDASRSGCSSRSC